MNAFEHRRMADDVAAWVLGALEPDGAERVERHLETCAECRADAERLRRSVDALPRSVEPLSPRPEVRAELMRAVRESAPARPAPRAAAPAPRRSRLLRPLALAGASAMLAVGLVAGFFAGRSSAPDPPRVVAAEVDGSRLPGASASLMIPAETGVPVLRLQGLEPPSGERVYQVWLLRGRELVPSSVFTPRMDGTGAAAIPESLAGVDAVLVTRERPGGARTPSEEPLLRVPV